MARPRIYCRWEIPKSIVIIVTAVIADYERRERILKDSNTSSKTVLDKAAELNAIVDAALEDIEPALRKDIVSDISDGWGYRRSNCRLVLHKDTYYNRRRKLIHDIAVAMRLI